MFPLETILRFGAYYPFLWMKVKLKLTFFWWKPPFFSYINDAVLMVIISNLHNKSSEVSIKTRSTPASLSLKRQATKRTSVKWSTAWHLVNFSKPFRDTEMHHMDSKNKICINDLVTSFLVAEGQVIEHETVNYPFIEAMWGSLCADSSRVPCGLVENWGKDAKAAAPPHFSCVAL